MTLDDLEAIKRKVEALRRDKDRADGRRAQVLQQINKEFGCKTVKEARALLAELKAKESSAPSTYTAEKERFERQWPNLLGQS